MSRKIIYFFVHIMRKSSAQTGDDPSKECTAAKHPRIRSTLRMHFALALVDKAMVVIRALVKVLLQEQGWG